MFIEYLTYLYFIHSLNKTIESHCIIYTHSEFHLNNDVIFTPNMLINIINLFNSYTFQRLCIFCAQNSNANDIAVVCISYFSIIAWFQSNTQYRSTVFTKLPKNYHPKSIALIAERVSIRKFSKNVLLSYIHRTEPNLRIYERVFGKKKRTTNKLIKTIHYFYTDSSLLATF